MRTRCGSHIIRKRKLQIKLQMVWEPGQCHQTMGPVGLGVALPGWNLWQFLGFHITSSESLWDRSIRLVNPISVCVLAAGENGKMSLRYVLLSSPVQMLAFSRNVFTATSKNNVQPDFWASHDPLQ